MAIKRDSKVIRLSSRKGLDMSSDRRVTTIAVIIASIIGLLLVFMPNAYGITIDGEFIGAIKDKKVIEGAKNTVITQLKGIYNADVKFEDELDVKWYRARKKDYIDQNYLISCMRNKMDILIAFKEIYVEGQSIGIVASQEEVNNLKDELKKKYYGDKEVQVDFDKKVEVKDIFAKEEDLISMDKLVQKCTATTPKSITYTVQAGDSLSGIADRFNVTMDSIISANQGFTKGTVLRLGQVINANINEPLLPLKVLNEGEKPQNLEEDGASPDKTTKDEAKKNEEQETEKSESKKAEN